MHFSTIFAATALIGAAVAENHFIAVSNKTGALAFFPDSLQAANGDTVTFRFWPKNHSVAQSSFAQPCAPMQNGFWTGFVPTQSADVVSNTSFTMEVTNASAPIWFYCSQGKHCQGGMVGVINPPRTGERTLAAYKNASTSAKDNLSPSTVAGTGGKINENGTATSGSPSASGSNPSQATGAASHLAGSAAFAGLTSFFAYLLI